MRDEEWLTEEELSGLIAEAKSRGDCCIKCRFWGSGFREEPLWATYKTGDLVHRYYDYSADCKRFPPTIYDADSDSFWQPVTKFTGWCGEFNLRDDWVSLVEER